jgi:hypothetical protein
MTCHIINILSKLDFSRWSAVQFGLKKYVKNTGIYLYSDGGISVFGICDIDPLYTCSSAIKAYKVRFNK